jgi:hypothetical protein
MKYFIGGNFSIKINLDRYIAYDILSIVEQTVAQQ